MCDEAGGSLEMRAPGLDDAIVAVLLRDEAAKLPSRDASMATSTGGKGSGMAGGRSAAESAP